VETADLIIVPVVILVQSIAIFVHFLVLVLELIVIPIPTMPTLVATSVLKRALWSFCTLSAR
jgi:hypothetical protein